MLTDIQLQCIEYLGEGLLTKVDIANKLEISDRVIYKWQKDNEEFKAELRKRSEEIQTVMKLEGKCRMSAKGQIAIDNIAKLANTADSEKVRLDANTFIYEVIFGKATTKIETNTEQEGKNNVSKDMLEDVFSESRKADNKGN